jgi:GNAT superfamily N-acetyltransferase
VSAAEPAAVELRPARAGEAEALRALLAAAKGHWGYAPERVAAWARTVDMAATLREQDVWVATEDGAPVAWAGLVPPRDGVAELEHLWVDPMHMGLGIGSALFRQAARRAAELGAVRMEWEAEPNALGFYHRMGGRELRTVVSEWGRTLSVMGVELTEGDRVRA